MIIVIIIIIYCFLLATWAGRDQPPVGGGISGVLNRKNALGFLSGV